MCTSCRGRWLILCRLVEPKHRTDGRLCQEIAGALGRDRESCKLQKPDVISASRISAVPWGVGCSALQRRYSPCLFSLDITTYTLSRHLERGQVQIVRFVAAASSDYAGDNNPCWPALRLVVLSAPRHCSLPPCGQILPCEVNNP